MIAAAMKFEECEIQLTEQDIAAAEASLGIRLPPELRELYFVSNGGYPDPYVHEDDNLDTVVSEFLPLRSERGRGTALVTYRLLVRKKRIVPAHFFPFAVDGGGDYFFVDCASPQGLVYFYASDNTEPLLALGVGVSEFWSRLKAE